MSVLTLQHPGSARCSLKRGIQPKPPCVRPLAELSDASTDVGIEIVMTLYSWDWAWNETVFTERLAGKMYDVSPPDLKKALGASSSIP